jgi:hypothetical protein
VKIGGPTLSEMLGRVESSFDVSSILVHGLHGAVVPVVVVGFVFFIYFVIYFFFGGGGEQQLPHHNNYWRLSSNWPDHRSNLA